MWVSVCATLAIGMPLILSPVLAQRNLTPSKTSESDSQADKLVISSAVERKRRDIGVMRLLGIPRRAMFCRFASKNELPEYLSRPPAAAERQRSPAPPGGP